MRKSRFLECLAPNRRYSKNRDSLVLFELVGMGYVILIGAGVLAFAAIVTLCGYRPKERPEPTHPLVSLLAWAFVALGLYVAHRLSIGYVPMPSGGF